MSELKEKIDSILANNSAISEEEEPKCPLDEPKGTFSYKNKTTSEIAAYWETLFHAIETDDDTIFLREEILRYIKERGFDIYPEYSIVLETVLAYLRCFCNPVDGAFTYGLCYFCNSIKIDEDGLSIWNTIVAECVRTAESTIRPDEKTGKPQYHIPEVAARFYALAADVQGMYPEVRNTAADSICNALSDFYDIERRVERALSYLSDTTEDALRDIPQENVNPVPEHGPLPTQIAGFLHNPTEIKAELDKRIIGQDDVKQLISVNLFKHIWSYEHHRSDIGNNIMLVGPTGSGKSMIARNIAELSGLPYVFIDASQITSAGWDGLNLSTTFRALLSYPKSVRDYAIVVFDEFDKLANQGYSAHGDNVGAKRQSIFLSLLEGTPVVDGEGNTIETKNMMFIFTGAFSDMFKKRDAKVKSIGFGEATQKTEAKPESNGLSKTFKLRQDLLNEGLIPEFVGRMSTIAEISTLTEEQMVDAVLNVPASAVQRNRRMLKDMAYQFKVDRKYIVSVVQQMRALGLGVRGANNFIEDRIKELLYSTFETGEKLIFLSDAPAPPFKANEGTRIPSGPARNRRATVRRTKADTPDVPSKKPAAENE